MMENNLIVSSGVGDDFNLEGAITNRSNSYTSVDMTKFNDAEKAKFFAAINSPEFKIADFVNKEIKMQNIYCEVIETTDMATGELIKLVRTIIIDDEGNGYSCASKGVFNSFSKIVNPYFYGPPPYDKPLIVVPTLVKTQKGFNTLTLIPKGFVK